MAHLLLVEPLVVTHNLVKCGFGDHLLALVLLLFLELRLDLLELFQRSIEANLQADSLSAWLPDSKTPTRSHILRPKLLRREFLRALSLLRTRLSRCELSFQDTLLISLGRTEAQAHIRAS
jgi:hypothetical protein